MSREWLGEVTCPSGKLLVVDLELLGMWSHSAPPCLPEWAASPETLKIAESALDYRVEGRDAAAATELFGPTAGWLYDRPADFVETFESAVAERKLEAHLVAAPERIPHRQRVEHALGRPGCAGVVEFYGVWAPCVGALPPDRPLSVYGTRTGAGDTPEGWRELELVVGTQRKARTEHVGHVAVDRARLAFVDVDGLATFCRTEPVDGKADFVFWGRDAAKAAARRRAPAIGDGKFGWLDLPLEEAHERSRAVEKLRDERGLVFVTDFRPHSYQHRARALLRSSPTQSTTLEVGDCKVCAIQASPGDEYYPVEVDRAHDGAVLAVRVVLGTE